MCDFQHFHDVKRLPSRVITTLKPNLVQNPSFASCLDSRVYVRGMSIENSAYLVAVPRYSMLRLIHPGLEDGIYTLSAHVKVVNNPMGAGEFTARIYVAENNILAISEKFSTLMGMGTDYCYLG